MRLQRFMHQRCPFVAQSQRIFDLLCRSKASGVSVPMEDGHVDRHIRKKAHQVPIGLLLLWFS